MPVDLEENTTLVTETPTTRESRLAFLTRRRMLVGLVGFILFLIALSMVSPTAKDGEDLSTEDGENANVDATEAGLLADIDEMMQRHEDYAINCTQEEYAKLQPGSHEYLVKEADCGSGYVYDDPKLREATTHVVLVGDWIRDKQRLSGCVSGNRCPHFPKCQISFAFNERDPVLTLADVIVVATPDAPVIQRVAHKSKKPKVRKILYWREAYWSAVPIQAQKNQYDLEMGVHFTSGVMNPNYLRRPRTLIAVSFVEFLPFHDRNEFALSIISNCGGQSERGSYLGHLSDYLGADRVHRYGNCGNRKLPPPPIRNAAKVIAKYKFYLSFENTIQDGYVSEKLFTVLNMPLLPVYLGAYNVPNITKIPSFIKVHDFNSIKSLAEYLLFLDANPSEYGRYHLWRKDSSLFTEEYLNMIKYKFPGQAEMSKYATAPGWARKAACCRLCNLPHLDEQIAKRQDSDLIPRVKTSEEINRELFGGKLHHRPGPKARLPYPGENATNADASHDGDDDEA